MTEKQFIQVKTKERNPEKAGYYHTDKGELFWYKSYSYWSCRDDRVSEEYPVFWYEPVQGVKEGIKECIDKLETKEAQVWWHAKERHECLMSCINELKTLLNGKD